MRSIPGPIALLVALIALAIVFAILQRFFRSVPAKPLLRRERAIDFVYWFFTPWVGRAVTMLAVGIAVGLIVLLFGKPSSAWFEQQHVALQIAELLVAADLLGYFAHRLFHRRRLWPFHAIHHSATDLDWLAATRLHPFNEAGQRLLQVLPLYLLGFRGTALAAVIPFFTFYALFEHANLRWDFGPLRCVLASPRFHRWHHTKAAEGKDKNFAGLFPWIDLLFGTYYLPRDRQPVDFGVDEDVPRGFIGQLAYPFRAQ
ncbi:MAG TPA: sterol desaturase family protein [Thermoanaerobaculia bacterium]|nr:sterol desaturase family protein [Thermoanaerobaculia bacterium]